MVLYDSDSDSDSDHYCERCERDFRTERDLLKHESKSSRHNICRDHRIDFRSALGLKEHFVQSRDHDYCQHCDEHFCDIQELYEHYDDRHCWCHSCLKIFKNDDGLQQHYQKSSAHDYCTLCRRDFRSPSNLEAHLNSSVHKAKDIHCPFCTKDFVSQSAMVLHLEHGACPSHVTRREVNRYVLQVDRNNLITKPNRLIGAASNQQTGSWVASEAAFNGMFYECYLCHKEFNKLSVLNQHLASPVHEEKIYRCAHVECKKQFSALSAFCQHVERGNCGVAKFREVQNVMDRLGSNMKRLTF